MTIESRIHRLKWRNKPFFHFLRNLLTGIHPHTRISHPQFLVNENLRLTVERKFIGNCKIQEGHRVLDVGCGLKPYSYILPRADWFGIDIFDGPNVDLVIDGVSDWEIPNEDFDAVLCTEVLEHAVNPEMVIREIWRVLKPGGVALITTPFIYGIHGEPNDFRRYTPHGLVMSCSNFNILGSGILGGIGSSTAINVNNWIALQISKRFILNLTLTPFFLIHCIVFNSVGKVFDHIDSTQSFGTNSWILLRKDHG